MNTKAKFPPAKLYISGPAGKLELHIDNVRENSKQITGVICHPHPLFGGTLQNKVVYTVAKAFNEIGARAVRFNFRGVGESAGSYDEGKGEVQDCLAVLNWVKEQFPDDKIILAGFSFGAYVAQSAGTQFPIQQLISIAPPVRSFAIAKLKLPSCPWLVIQGEEDEVVPPQAVFAWLETLDPQPKIIRFPKAGHFFHGQLVELRQAIVTNITL